MIKRVASYIFYGAIAVVFILPLAIILRILTKYE
jgi:hypothetical protein